MPQDGKFDVKSRLRSFRFAGSGLAALVREQHNARIHLAVAALVVGLGLFFGVSRLEWCVLVLAISLVFCAEAVNTALEHLADAVMPERHPLVGRAKDAAAGGVLACAVGAAIVGVLVFLPHVLAWLGGGAG